MAKKPKGKMKYWRRMAEKSYDGSTEKRNGRQIRNQMIDFGKMKFPSFTVIEMMKRGGISTPVFDSMMSKLYNTLTTPKTEGDVNAAE